MAPAPARMKRRSNLETLCLTGRLNFWSKDAPSAAGAGLSHAVNTQEAARLYCPLHAAKGPVYRRQTKI